MSQIQLNFNANNFQPQWAGGGGNLGLGKHPVIITGAETKPTNAGDGGMLVFKLQAIDGPSKGSTQDMRLNLWNKSQTAVEIANKQLSAVCHAVKTYDVPVPDVLFNKPFVIENGPGSDPRYVEIIGVSDMSGGAPGGAAQGGNPNPPPQQQQQNGGFQNNNGGGFDPNQGGYGQTQQQGGGFTPPNQGGGFTPPGGPANNGGGFTPPGGGAPNGGGFTPPGGGGFTPPGGAPQGAGGFTPPGGGAAQGGWGPR